MAYKNFKTYIFNIAVGFDQLANTFIAGYPDETMSSRCYRNSQKYWYANVGRAILDFLFRPFGKEHCKGAYEKELYNKQNFNPIEPPKEQE